MSYIDDFKQKSPKQRFLFILGLVMFVVYVAVGFALIFREGIITALPRYGQIGVGVFLIVYGFIRLLSLNRRYE